MISGAKQTPNWQQRLRKAAGAQLPPDDTCSAARRWRASGGADAKRRPWGHGQGHGQEGTGGVPASATRDAAARRRRTGRGPTPAHPGAAPRGGRPARPHVHRLLRPPGTAASPGDSLASGTPRAIEIGYTSARSTHDRGRPRCPSSLPALPGSGGAAGDAQGVAGCGTAGPPSATEWGAAAGSGVRAG